MDFASTFPCRQKPHQIVLEERSTGLVAQQLLGLVVQHIELLRQGRPVMFQRTALAAQHNLEPGAAPAQRKPLEAAHKNHQLSEQAGVHRKHGSAVEPEPTFEVVAQDRKSVV